MVALDLDKLYEYPFGIDLLNDTLMEHERLLWQLERWATDPQSDSPSDLPNRLQLVKTQILLFERLMIGGKIDSLVVLVNHYAEILSRPRAKFAEIKNE